MTIGQGHPDYQDYAQWRGPTIAQGQASVTTGSPLTVTEYVTNWASVYLLIEQVGGIGTAVSVEFFTDNTESVLVASFSYILNFDTQLSVEVPVLGNYMQVSVTTNQAGTQTIIYTIVPANLQHPNILYPANNNYVSDLSVTVGAGGNVTLILPFVMEGQGYAFCNPHSGTSTQALTVWALSEAGAQAIMLAKSTATGAPFSLDFIAIGQPIELEIANTSAGNETYDVFMTVRCEP